MEPAKESVSISSNNGKVWYKYGQKDVEHVLGYCQGAGIDVKVMFVKLKV